MALRAVGIKAPTGAKRIAASRGLGGEILGAACPSHTQRPCELLPCCVSRFGEGVHLAPLMNRQLSQEMGGGPETVQTQALPESGEAIGSVSA